MTDEAPPYDIVIAGGGLAGGLIALALRAARPDLRMVLVERDTMLGGNHVWSFFDSDMDDAARALVAPLVTYRWSDGHDVRFAGRDRTLRAGYASVTSARFDAHLRKALGGGSLLLGAGVAGVAADKIMLDTGRTIRAGAVIDARGFAGPDDPLLRVLACGWQKFVGRTVRLATPHGLTRPVIMDADVDQGDGYRFVYVLPVGTHEVFVEDTYYADDPALDMQAIVRRIDAYATQRGWQVTDVVHQESGVLPVVIGGDFDEFWPRADGVARAGVRAGLFHPTTGYSLPHAARFALYLARLPDLSGPALARESRAYARLHWRAGGFYRMLDTMLFRAAPPEQRHRIFARFYRLGEPLIGRFYAGRTSMADKIRILCGRPPVSIRAAVRALLHRKRS